MRLGQKYAVLPRELVDTIDALVGREGRVAFLVETAKAELQRRRIDIQHDQDNGTGRGSA